MLLEKRKFCKIFSEIDNITDSVLVVLRISDLQLHHGLSVQGVQVKTHKASINEERENANMARPVFIPPLNESLVYEDALACADSEDLRITELQSRNLT